MNKSNNNPARQYRIQKLKLCCTRVSNFTISLQKKKKNQTHDWQKRKKNIDFDTTIRKDIIFNTSYMILIKTHVEIQPNNLNKSSKSAKNTPCVIAGTKRSCRRGWLKRREKNEHTQNPTWILIYNFSANRATGVIREKKY